MSINVEETIRDQIKTIFPEVKPPVEASDIDLSEAGKLAVKVGLERFVKLDEYNKILEKKMDEMREHIKLQQLEIDHLKIQLHDAKTYAHTCQAEKEAAVLARTAIEAKMQMIISSLKHTCSETESILNGSDDMIDTITWEKQRV